jgi:hypothetical protein
MKAILTICCVLLFADMVSAQEMPPHFYSLQEIVKPSMNAEYMSFLKNVKITYQQKEVNFNYSIFRQDDFTYYIFMPLHDMNIGTFYKTFGDVEAKVGKEAFANLFAAKANCIESSQEFVTKLLPQYTYLTPGKEDNFRQFTFWFPLPGKQAEVEQISKEWVALHKSKNAPRGYHTFQTILGQEQGYVVVSWGKDQMDLLGKIKATNGLFGEEGAKLWARTLAITRKIYHKDAWYLPEVSYFYQPAPVRQ